MQDFGGAGTAALRLHEGLTQEGANNTFYVQNIDKWKDKTALLSQAHPSAKNGKFISPEWRAFQARNKQTLSRYPNRPSGLEMFSIPWAATKLKDIPELQNADIINLHWISGTLSIPDNIDFLKGKKVVWTLHDMNPFTGGCHYAGECRGYEKYCGNCPQLGSNQENDLSREIWKLKKTAYRELNIEIVVLCDWMAKCVKKSSLLSSFPVHVIPNGLPTDVFKPYPQDQIRESLQVPKDAFVILFGADSVVNTRKGFVYLLRALEHLKELDISKQIALVTFGHNAQAEVQHLGFPTFAFDYVDKESELALIYSMADVTVIPSLEDNLPNVVLESLACGTPVVGFDVGGIPDMIEHQVNGFLAPIGNDEELAKGIHWIMDRKNSNKQIRLKCRETVLSRYNLPLQAKKYKKLYEKILKKP
jgi:glycosyltransferase involved in cell wall biosynthesis